MNDDEEFQEMLREEEQLNEETAALQLELAKLQKSHDNN